MTFASSGGRRILTAVAAGSVIGAMTPGTASAAGAATSDSSRARVCETGIFYSFSGGKAIYIRAKNGRVYGQRGVTLSISKGVSKTIGGSVTGTGTAEAGLIFAKASASLSISVEVSRTTTTTFGASWKVPKSQDVGWLEVGTRNGHTFTWERYHYASPCNKVVDASGRGRGPTRNASLMFKHS
jgi:hypothetical protein